MEYTDVQLLKELESLMTQLYSPNDDLKFRENLMRLLINLINSKLNVDDGGGGGSNPPGGDSGSIQINDGNGGFKGSNSLRYDDIGGLVSVPGFSASDGLGNYANISIYDDGEGNIFLSLGGAGTVPIRLNLSNGGGFDLNGLFADFTMTDLTQNRSFNLPDRSGTVALTTDVVATELRTGTVIAFDFPATYGEATPETGNITINTTGAINGIVQLVLHNSGSTPSFTAPGGATLTKLQGTYVTSTLNYIYIERISGTKYIYSILQAG